MRDAALHPYLLSVESIVGNGHHSKTSDHRRPCNWLKTPDRLALSHRTNDNVFLASVHGMVSNRKTRLFRCREPCLYVYKSQCRQQTSPCHTSHILYCSNTLRVTPSCLIFMLCVSFHTTKSLIFAWTTNHPDGVIRWSDPRTICTNYMIPPFTDSTFTFHDVTPSSLCVNI